MDDILSEPTLHIGDHLALANTCKTLRSCYYTQPPSSFPSKPFTSPIWEALLAARPFGATSTDEQKEPTAEQEAIVRSLCSRNDRNNPLKLVVADKLVLPPRFVYVQGVFHPLRSKTLVYAVRSKEWDEAIGKVYRKGRITNGLGMKLYAVTYENMDSLHKSWDRSPSHFYDFLEGTVNEAQLEATALRVHGGPLGLARARASGRKIKHRTLKSLPRAPQDSSESEEEEQETAPAVDADAAPLREDESVDEAEKDAAVGEEAAPVPSADDLPNPPLATPVTPTKRKRKLDAEGEAPSSKRRRLSR
ncbi:hypothetical protein JCM10450v2_000990 [Rhodotorula kratochvilovae]